MRLILPALVALIALAFAGCASDDDPTTDDLTIPSPTPTGSASPGPAGSNTTGPGPSGTGAPPTSGAPTQDRAVTLTADAVEGSAPLVVLFSIEATGEAASWSLAFGDGASAEGDTLPGEAEHTYEAGEFEAVATVTYADGTTVDSEPLAISATELAGPQPIHLEFGGNMPAFFPAFEAPVDHPAMVRAAQENDLNGTYVVYYDVVVEEGVTAVAFEGGTEEVAEGLPDFDIVILAPTGDLTGGSEGAYEHLVVDAPTAGTYTFAVLYWAGPPNQAFTAVVDVAY